LITTSETPSYYPFECIATGRSDGEFIDTGMRHPINHMYDEVHVYLHRAYVEDLAREHCEMVPKVEHDKIKDRFAARLAEQDKRIAELHELVEASRRLEEAVA
jgi:hypothetical protein